MTFSLRSLILPPLTQWWLSPQRMQAQRLRRERQRQAQGRPHTVHYFHQTDDPYCALLTQVLGPFAQRYQVQWVPHLVGPPGDAAAPDRPRLVAHSRRDAQLLAQRHGLRFEDPGAQPEAGAVLATEALLHGAIARGDFVAQAAPAMAALWSEPHQSARPLDGSLRQALERQRAQDQALRQRWGHYLGGTFYYEGEWYVGIDRLYHLERRLQELGAALPSAAAGLMFAPAADLSQARPSAVRQFDFFLSLRSPYTAIVAQRVFDLARHTGAQVRLRYLLPMAMRGLPVPRAKRMYIAWDAAREARERAVPFGRLLDPLGAATERGLAVLALAQREGLGPAFLLSFLQGVWSQGVDARSDAGLRRLAERVGLTWTQVGQALRETAWREQAEANRLELLQRGLWGVPAFGVGTQMFWGQDRLWGVQQALFDERLAA